MRASPASRPSALRVVHSNAGHAVPFPPFVHPQLYHRSLTSHASGESGGSARSGSGGGRKTPREEEGGDAATSPNDRLRKQASRLRVQLGRVDIGRAGLVQRCAARCRCCAASCMRAGC